MERGWFHDATGFFTTTTNPITYAEQAGEAIGEPIAEFFGGAARGAAGALLSSTGGLLIIGLGYVILKGKKIL